MVRNYWNEKEYRKIAKSDLKVRAYTLNLLGMDKELVLHGGGNTSVKTRVRDIHSQWIDLLLKWILLLRE